MNRQITNSAHWIMVVGDNNPRITVKFILDKNCAYELAIYCVSNYIKVFHLQKDVDINITNIYNIMEYMKKDVVELVVTATQPEWNKLMEYYVNIDLHRFHGDKEVLKSMIDLVLTYIRETVKSAVENHKAKKTRRKDRDDYYE